MTLDRPTTRPKSRGNMSCLDFEDHSCQWNCKKKQKKLRGLRSGFLKFIMNWQSESYFFFSTVVSIKRNDGPPLTILRPYYTGRWRWSLLWRSRPRLLFLESFESSSCSFSFLYKPQLHEFYFTTAEVISERNINRSYRRSLPSFRFESLHVLSGVSKLVQNPTPSWNVWQGRVCLWIQKGPSTIESTDKLYSLYVSTSHGSPALVQ